MKRRSLVIIFIALAVIAAGLCGLSLYINSTSPVSDKPDFGPSGPTPDIFASGFIEAKDISIASEVGGRIVHIAVDEGDEVKAGVSLVELDDSLLRAEQRQTEVAVELARAGLEQAIVSRDGAKKAWENALDVQRDPLELEAKIIAAEGELDMAELDLERVEKQDGKWEEDIAELRRDIAEDILENLQDIEDNPQEINAAVDEAHAAYQMAVAAVEVAERQVEQAETSLEIIEVQLSKLMLNSPISGVVAARYSEVGEIAQPGVPILTITDLEEVTLTAYVPESKIGWVKLGQEAVVSVDSYPGERFSGKVVYISPRALFTPKNIQMKEEREKIVFAVKIGLPNTEQKLKPGMPADAQILISGSMP